MQKDKIPTTRALLVGSWAIPVLGTIRGGYLIISKFNNIDLLMRGLLIVLGSLVLAVVVRMFANIGQMIFELRSMVEQINCDSKDINQDIHQLKIFFEQIREHLDLKK